MAKFAKRHYEAIAEAMQETIRGCNSSEQVAIAWRAIGEVARVFASDNCQFDRDRFLRACEPGANVRARS